MVAWLRLHAVALTTNDPAAPFADLASLGQAFDGARIVGLGEATHGTREHFLMKHRLFRFLVEEKGFRILAMEADGAAGCALDAYVRTGKGDPVPALSDLGFWTWNTQEVLDLVRWMREHNRRAPEGSELRFMGLDMQNPRTATDRVAEFLHGIDPRLEREAREAGSCLGPFDNLHEFSATYRERPPEVQAACSTRLAALLDRLVTERAAWAPRDFAGYDCAVWSARLLTQSEKLLRIATARDGLMADNAQALLESAGKGGGVVIWAHNAHVAKTFGAMGRRLDRRLGRKYLSVGQAFARGSFHARGRRSGERLAPVIEHLAPDPRADSYEAAFERVDLPLFVLDLRLAKGPEAVWLAGPHPLRDVGGSYDGLSDGSSYALTDAFDLVIFHQQSSPSQRLPHPPLTPRGRAAP